MARINSGLLTRIAAPFCKFTLALGAALGIASAVYAENYWWTGSGTDTNYDTPANWGSENGSTYPGSDDGAMFNGAAAEKTVTFNGAYTPSWIWVATDDVTKPVTWTATAGGSASTTFNIGLADQSDQVGALVVESGTYTAAGGFNVGPGQAAFEMTGGTITANGVSQWAYAENAALTADIKGGTLNFNGVDGNDGLRMMYGTGVSNVITVSNATFAVNNGDLVIGVDADATSSTTINIDQDGVVSCGTPSIHRWLKMNSLGKVTINVNEGGTLAVWHIAHDAAGECKINLNGGKLKVLGGAGAGVIGDENDASLIVTVGEKGGTLEVPTGVSASVLKNLKGEGTLTVTGGGSATFAPQGNTCQIVANGATVLTNVDNHWNAGGGVDTDWNTSSNWDTGLGGALNAVFHSAYLNGAETTATFAGAYSYQAGLWIENGLDGIVTFSKAESAVDTAGLAVANNITIGTATSGALKIASGTYSVNGSLFVGYSTGSASLTMEDGTVSVVGDFDVGIKAATSTFTQNGGTITGGANGWWGADNSKAVADINDGSISFTGNLNLLNQNDTGDAASYITNTVAGGTLSANEIWFLGKAGHATVNLSSGTIETGKFGVNGSGIYAINISGGTVVAAADGTFIPASDKLTVTVDGNATLNTNGKTITIDAAMLGDGTLTCVGGGTVTFTSLDSTCTIVQAEDGTIVNKPTVYYWIGGGTGNWNDKDNWSLSAGGAAAEDYPGEGSVVCLANGSVVTITESVKVYKVVVDGTATLKSGSNYLTAQYIVGDADDLLVLSGARIKGYEASNEISVPLKIDTDTENMLYTDHLGFNTGCGITVSSSISGNGTLVIYAYAAGGSGSNVNAGITLTGDNAKFSGIIEYRSGEYQNSGTKFQARQHDNLVAAASSENAEWRFYMNNTGTPDRKSDYVLFSTANGLYKFGAAQINLPVAAYTTAAGITFEIGNLDKDSEIKGTWGNAPTVNWVAATNVLTMSAQNNGNINVMRGGTLNISGSNILRAGGMITYSGADGMLKIAPNVDFDPSTYLAASGSVAITFDDEGYWREWSGNLAGIYAFTKEGSGTLTLTSVPTYGGPTKVLNGKLVVPFGTALSTLEISGNATVEVDMTDAAANATAFSVGKIVGDKSKISLVNNTSGVEFTLVETATGLVYVNGSRRQAMVLTRGNFRLFHRCIPWMFIT